MGLSYFYVICIPMTASSVASAFSSRRPSLNHHEWFVNWLRQQAKALFLFSFVTKSIEMSDGAVTPRCHPQETTRIARFIKKDIKCQCFCALRAMARALS
jgi:hypothetical protein